ncbi:MAG: site-specific DNA-methyltransferase [Patescibacteria group bacterium]|nr:site-specific DNA-methyltransferase [Patescibacteria group bacterium]
MPNDNFADKQAFYQFLYDALSAMRPFVRGDVYVAMSSSELHTLQKAFIDCGGHWSTFIIWVKNTFTIGRANYQRQYEPILYGWFEGSSHYWSGRRNLGDVVKEVMREEVDGTKWLKIEEGGIETDIWEFPKPTKNKEHPTMKPIALCTRAISNSSLRDEIVLDLFGGSGSTLIAAEQTGRMCYMMELDPKYCDVIRKRYEILTGQNS